MGLAIIIPGISFSGAGLGTATLKETVPLTSIAITGADSVEISGNKTTYYVDYTPTNTSERSITWSIVDGSTYATINADTGVLTVLDTAAEASNVTIRATSKIHAEIYSEKIISVKYYDDSGVSYYEELTAITTNGYSLIDTGIMIDEDMDVTIKYKINTPENGYVWSEIVDNDYQAHYLEYNKATYNIGNDKASSSALTKGVMYQGTSIIGTLITAIISNTSLTVNGSTPSINKAGSGHCQPNINCFLAGKKSNPSSFHFSDNNLEIYSFTASKEGSNIVNLIPCKLILEVPAYRAVDGEVHSIGEIGMWDKVTNKFVANANTEGSFVEVS